MMTLATGTVLAIRDRLALRRRIVTVGLLAMLVICFALALSLGDYPVSGGDLLRALFSPLTGQVDKGVDFIVLNVRLPRALLAVLTGAAFALSGIIFQTILRNPLASPDIIGISHGASATAVFCIVTLGWTGVALSLGALLGAVATAAAIYLLAWRGGASAYRVVLVGIGMAAIMGSVISWLFTRARINEVQEALAWLVGSLNGANMGEVWPMAGVMLILLPVTVALSKSLDVLQLGDDAARALGARVERSRLCLMLVAVALAAFATAAVGPVGFVAFVAGPIARALLDGAGKGLPQAALVGAVVMLGSDMMAQHALPDMQLPVGVVTGLFGAIFLLYLLVLSNRAGRAS